MEETPQKRGTTLPETVPMGLGPSKVAPSERTYISFLLSFHPCRLQGPQLPDICGHFRRGGIFKEQCPFWETLILQLKFWDCPGQSYMQALCVGSEKSLMG